MAYSSVVFQSNADVVIEELNKRVVKALNNVGARARQISKERYCPVVTGKLQGSIHYKIDEAEGGYGVTLYSDCEYAQYVELGHHQEPGRYVPAIGKRLVRDWVPPHPFIRPAIERHSSEYARIITNALKQ